MNSTVEQALRVAPSDDALARQDATPQGVQGKLPALTSLRFFAAALIVVHHSKGVFGFPFRLWYPLVLDQAVTFFFILSGFILAYVYPSLGKGDRRRFLLARFARIYPAHIAAFVLLYFLRPYSFRFTPINTPLMMLANLALVHAWIPIQRFSTAFNGPSWSISVEFAFYLCFILLIPNWRRTWHIKMGSALLVAIIAIVLGNVLHLPVAVPETSNALGITSLLYFSPFTRLFEFTLGMTTALAFRFFAPRVRLGLGNGTFVECAVLVVTVAAMFLTRSVSENRYLAWVGTAGQIWLKHTGVTCLAFAALILTMALERGMLSRWLAFPLFVLLGEISYTVYLIHQILIVYVYDHPRVFQTIPQWIAYLVFWLMTLLISYIVWAMIERPGRRFLIALWPRRNAAGTMAVNRVADVDIHLSKGTQRLPWTTPTWSRIAMAAFVLAPLVGSTAYLVANPPKLPSVDAAIVSDLAAHGLPEADTVQFGEKFLLRGAKMRRTSTGVTLEVVWQSLNEEHLDWTIAVHCVDTAGTILSQADYPQDTAQSTVHKGDTWRDTVDIPAGKLKGSVSAIAIAIYRPGGDTLTVDHGPRDWGNYRLLLPFRPTLQSDPEILTRA